MVYVLNVNKKCYFLNPRLFKFQAFPNGQFKMSIKIYGEILKTTFLGRLVI